MQVVTTGAAAFESLYGRIAEDLKTPGSLDKNTKVGYAKEFAELKAGFKDARALLIEHEKLNTRAKVVHPAHAPLPLHLQGTLDSQLHSAACSVPR